MTARKRSRSACVPFIAVLFLEVHVVQSSVLPEPVRNARSGPSPVDVALVKQIPRPFLQSKRAIRKHVRKSKQAGTGLALASTASTATRPFKARVAHASSAGSASQLDFWGSMFCGAVSRSVAKTLTHPANTMKTILQTSRCTAPKCEDTVTIASLARPSNMRLLSRGAGAQFVLSAGLGAVNFAVLERTRSEMNDALSQSRRLSTWVKTPDGAVGAGLDFLSSAVSTFVCSVFSVPHMVIMDNIMAGTYPNLPAAVRTIASEGGVVSFYRGWWPHIAGKVPSYGLSWAFFQQLKRTHSRVFRRSPRNVENTIMGCMASGATVCLMIPLETVKTRLVTQALYPNLVPYKGIMDGFARIVSEEGAGTLFLGLTPRLASVVPMMGIQFGVYEFMKRQYLESRQEQTEASKMAGAI